jgi:hypothetical protein
MCQTVKGRIVFVCDGCLVQLGDEDSGEFYWENFGNFLEDVRLGEDTEPTLLLCRRCLRQQPAVSR